MTDQDKGIPDAKESTKPVKRNEYKITLPIALLQAACIAAADDDMWRPQLENVVIDNGHIVATNSHIMFWAKLDNVSADIKIYIPRIHVECFIKKTEKFKGFTCDIVYNTDAKQGYLEIPNCLNCYEGFKVFFDSYINWQKVIPQNAAESHDGYPQFQTKYHAALDDIANTLGSICSPKIIPHGSRSPATIDFLYSEFDNVHACLMPLDLTYSTVKYCVEILHEPDNAEPEQLAAASAEIALRAVKRLRKNQCNLFGVSRAEWIRPALWQGTDEDHQNKMFYTEDWFNQPVRQYDNAEKAIEYLNSMPGEVVRCFVGNVEIHARTTVEIEKFFNQNNESIGKTELLSLNKKEDKEDA